MSFLTVYSNYLLLVLLLRVYVPVTDVIYVKYAKDKVMADWIGFINAKWYLYILLSVWDQRAIWGVFRLNLDAHLIYWFFDLSCGFALKLHKHVIHILPHSGLLLKQENEIPWSFYEKILFNILAIFDTLEILSELYYLKVLICFNYRWYWLKFDF